jgi:HSP20 family protein
MTDIIKRSSAVDTPLTIGGLVDNVFRTSLNRFFDDDFWGFDGILTPSQAPVNVRETDKTYEMEVVAPGCKKEDFTVELSNNLLTVSCNHKEEKDEQRNGWMRREYKHRAFTRTFTLNDTVDANNISAKYEDGMLHITLPKKPEAQRVTKAIAIR